MAMFICSANFHVNQVGTTSDKGKFWGHSQANKWCHN